DNDTVNTASSTNAQASTIGGNVTINLGAGNNALRIGNLSLTATQTGGGSLTINGGASADAVTLNNLDLMGDLNANLGAGNDTLSITASTPAGGTVAGDVSIDMGAG